MFKKKEIEKEAEPKAKPAAGITEREQNINTHSCNRYYDMRGD